MERQRLEREMEKLNNEIAEEEAKREEQRVRFVEGIKAQIEEKEKEKREEEEEGGAHVSGGLPPTDQRDGAETSELGLEQRARNRGQYVVKLKTTFIAC